MATEISALEIADRLIHLSLEDEMPITPMQAQKLTYFCNAWMLGLDGIPLFRDAVEAWQYGPVIRELYHRLRHYGRRYIDQPIHETPSNLPERAEAIIRAVWSQYGGLDGLRLSKLTHAAGSPWDQTYKQGRGSQIIHTHVIRNYYTTLVAQRRAS